MKILTTPKRKDWARSGTRPDSSAPDTGRPDGSLPGPHADFFNGWDQAALEALVASCANTGHGNDGPCKQPS